MTYNKVPSINECYEIMKDRMLPHIKEHSEQVMLVAMAIINNLKPDVVINRDLVIAGSLLHDITKTRSLTTKEHHDTTGAILLRELGYSNVADIIEEHVELKQYDFNDELKEKEIVFYADKRVTHNKIVAVEERVSDLLTRYGKTENIRQHILKNKKSILEIEKKINNYILKDINDVISSLK
ncbi:MAG: HDIG domain-containing protein [Spirochaetes bacterium]|nr:HDIG domain-containing protein [Spirochaetota bacterium]